LISIKNAGGYPPSILKVFYWHKNGWWIPTKHLKRLFFWHEKGWWIPTKQFKSLLLA
jgi:hypothetical protein